MIKAGRKGKVNSEKLKKIFLKYGDVCRNRSIKYNDPVFKTISNELDNTIAPYAIYKALKRHYDEYFQNDEDDNLYSPRVQSS